MGNADIIAYTENKIAVCHVSVVPAKAESFNLSSEQLSLSIGEIYTLKGNFLPENTENKTIEWIVPENTVINSSVVNNNLNIVGIGEGNVTILAPSSYPDVKGGNFVLAAHSGNGYLSFFRNLYKLSEGDIAYVTYNNVKYNYRLVKKYDVDKNGTVTIDRNYDKSCLTLITCTKDDDYHQSVYIFERV